MSLKSILLIGLARMFRTMFGFGKRFAGGAVKRAVKTGGKIKRTIKTRGKKILKRTGKSAENTAGKRTGKSAENTAGKMTGKIAEGSAGEKFKKPDIGKNMDAASAIMDAASAIIGDDSNATSAKHNGHNLSPSKPG